MKEVFVGFDSAWGGHRAGAMAWAVFQDNELIEAPPPRPVGFADAAELIEKLQATCNHLLIAIDQPLIVPNDFDARPVDYAVDSFMRQQLNSRALRVNRTERGRGFNNMYLHGDEAPAWRFMSRIGPCAYSGTTDGHKTCAFVDFREAQVPSGNTHAIEVYPALALAALNPNLIDRGSAARYDPENWRRPYPFALEDWQLVCDTVARFAEQSGLQDLSRWAETMVAPWDSPTRPKKLHQDKIDAAICLLVAVMWRRQTDNVCVIGDLETGYIVTPISVATRPGLEMACRKNNVDF